jgi:hypothetical protein
LLILPMIAIVDDIVAVALAVVVFRRGVTKMGKTMATARSSTTRRLPPRIKQAFLFLCGSSLSEESCILLR